MLAGSPLELPAEARALEADLLIAHALGITSSQVAIHLERKLALAEQERCKECIKRRADGEPVASIVGQREFYGRPFEVAPAVLVPRPETELLVDRGLTLIRRELEEDSGVVQVVDVGTGSGCIIVSLAAELQAAGVSMSAVRLVGLDISEEALVVAKRNAEVLGVDAYVEFFQSDLFASFDTSNGSAATEIVISNPPYIAENEILPYDVEHFEPRLALRSGPEGLQHIVRLLGQYSERLSRILLLEIGDGQSHALECLLAEMGLKKYQFFKDLRGIRRVVEVCNERA